MSDHPSDAQAARVAPAATTLRGSGHQNDGGAGQISGSAAELFPLVYGQLKQLARQRMTDERAGHTLQATALVHEVYMRLAGGSGAAVWSGRPQFFFAAAEAMRRILIDHARARGGLKRVGSRRQLPLNSVLDLAANEQFPQILALDEALLRLQKVSESAAAVVRLRFYTGLDIDEAAAVMGVSPRTVKREWTYARAWLARELKDYPL